MDLICQRWFLPFSTQYTVDNQASPQTQKGRPVPSTHICDMRTFHCWRPKRERGERVSKRISINSKSYKPVVHHYFQHFPHISGQQARGCCKNQSQHRSGGSEGYASPPLSQIQWQRMNQTKWPCHMRWAITLPLDTRTLHHHFELSVTLTETYSAL